MRLVVGSQSGSRNIDVAWSARINEGSREEVEDQPEWHRFIIVLDHTSLLSF
jgi:hypothetical protein